MWVLQYSFMHVVIYRLIAARNAGKNVKIHEIFRDKNCFLIKKRSELKKLAHVVETFTMNYKHCPSLNFVSKRRQ